MQVTILNSQTLQDIAIQYCGTLEALFDIAFLNNISVTEELSPGQILNIPEVDYGFQEVVNYFLINKKQPATALTQEMISIIEGNTGIDYWALENNFIIQ
jgi:hypothetical protein